MSQLGLGVMIQMLRGNEESVAAYRGALGKTIKNLGLMSDESLRLEFTDGSAIKFFDDGQSCCETRYMTTDDKLDDFAGATFAGVRIEEADNRPGDEEHEVQFLLVDTSKGTFTMESHNEHNGYYGGFALVCRTANNDHA